MEIPSVSVDIAIITALIAGAVIGVLGGRGRLRPIILSVYVGLILGEQLAGPLKPFLFGLNQDQSAWLLFTAPILIFGFFGGRGRRHAPRGVVWVNALVGTLTGALAMAAALMLMPLAGQSVVAANSWLALNLQYSRPWLLGLMPVVALLLDFIKGHKKH